MPPLFGSKCRILSWVHVGGGDGIAIQNFPQGCCEVTNQSTRAGGYASCLVPQPVVDNFYFLLLFIYSPEPIFASVFLVEFFFHQKIAGLLPIREVFFSAWVFLGFCVWTISDFSPLISPQNQKTFSNRNANRIQMEVKVGFSEGLRFGACAWSISTLFGMVRYFFWNLNPNIIWTRIKVYC